MFLIVMMLLLLIIAFALFAGLVRFAETIIQPRRETAPLHINAAPRRMNTSDAAP